MSMTAGKRFGRGRAITDLATLLIALAPTDEQIKNMASGICLRIVNMTASARINGNRKKFEPAHETCVKNRSRATVRLAANHSRICLSSRTIGSRRIANTPEIRTISIAIQQAKAILYLFARSDIQSFSVPE